MQGKSRDQSGAFLIETLVALAILSSVAVAFLGGLTTASRTFILADKRTAAHSLAMSNMERTRNAPYSYNATAYDAEVPAVADYTGYSVAVAAGPVHGMDDGIQKITVIISRSASEVLRLTGYKVDR